MNHNRSPSFRRSPIQKPEGDSIKHKDKSSRQSFIHHHGASLKATDQPTCSKKILDPNDIRKHSNTQLNGFHIGPLTASIYQPSMKYKNIGKSGLKIPSYGIAVWQNMSKMSEEQVESIIQTAYENGIYYFDTGDAFANGKSEQLLGNVINKLDWPRNSFVISTKLFWNHPVTDHQNRNKHIALNRKYLIEAVKASLKRLKLDYIDLVLINRLDGMCPTEEIVRTMNILINNNLILYWGTSRWSHVHIQEAFSVCRFFNCIPPIVEQMEYSPTSNREKCEIHLNELYHRLGIGVISWSGNLVGADAGISLISRKSLIEYQNMYLVEESIQLQNALAAAVDRVEEAIVSVPIPKESESEGGKLSGLMKLSRKLSTPERKRAEKNLSVASDRTADRLSIDQSIDKRSMISTNEQSSRLAELDAIINKLNLTRAQFDAIWNLRNEPVCCSLIQPQSTKELQLYLDALKVEVPIAMLQEVDRVCTKYGKFPVAGSTCELVGDLDRTIEDEPSGVSNV